jgi:hypothetical protein
MDGIETNVRNELVKVIDNPLFVKDGKSELFSPLEVFSACSLVQSLADNCPCFEGNVYGA